MTRRLEKEDDSRQGFPHYMLKEIHEQPRVLEITLASLLQGTSALDMLGIDRRYAQSIQRIELAACGTSWHAALIARRAIEELVGIPTTADIASEYRDWPRRQREGTLTIVISQSGETTDTLEAMRSAKRAGFRTGAIVNVPGSTMAREADGTIVTQAGTEVAIASTKAFTCQVAALLSIALGPGRMRGAMDAARRGPGPRARAEAGGDHPPRRGLARARRRPRADQAGELLLPRPWIRLSRRARRRAEAQGDELRPRRGVPVGRVSSRADRAHFRR